MSRVGKQIISIPSGVTVEVADDVVRVKGPKGTLEERLHPNVTVTVENSEVRVTVADPDLKNDRALWGLFGSLIRSMVIGVTQGFGKKLEIHGVGYKMALQGQVLRLDVGFSHPVMFPIPQDVTVTVDKNTIMVQGNSKQRVGEVAAQIRHVKKPEPYKGKGIRYTDEVVRRKAGKTAAKTAS